MSRKLFAGLVLALGSLVIVSASAAAVDEAPAPRLVGEDGKKAEGKGKFGGVGKFGEKGGFPFPGRFGKGGFDLEKLKERFGKGGFDPDKLKEWQGKFGKGGFPGGKGGFPGRKGDK